MEFCRKFVDLNDRSRRNNLQILRVKEDPRESCEECKNKIFDLLEEKLEMNTRSTERAQCLGENSNNKERAIVIQHSFYKNKQNIIRNCKRLKEISIFKDFSHKKCKFIKKNGRRY